jgi:hypothetical protein
LIEQNGVSKSRRQAKKAKKYRPWADFTDTGRDFCWQQG